MSGMGEPFVNAVKQRLQVGCRPALALSSVQSLAGLTIASASAGSPSVSQAPVTSLQTYPPPRPGDSP